MKIKIDLFLILEQVGKCLKKYELTRLHRWMFLLAEPPSAKVDIKAKGLFVCLFNYFSIFFPSITVPIL